MCIYICEKQRLPSQRMHKDELEYEKGPDHDLGTRPRLRTTTRNRVRRGRPSIWILSILSKSRIPRLCYSSQGYTPTKPFQSMHLIIYSMQLYIKHLLKRSPKTTTSYFMIHSFGDKGLRDIPLHTWFFRFFQSIVTFFTPLFSCHAGGFYKIVQASQHSNNVLDLLFFLPSRS